LLRKPDLGKFHLPEECHFLFGGTKKRQKNEYTQRVILIGLHAVYYIKLYFKDFILKNIVKDDIIVYEKVSKPL